MNPETKKILILGIGKSGTTALFHAIASAVPSSYKLIFEPSRLDQIVSQVSPPDGLVCKMLVSNSSVFLQEFPAIVYQLNRFFSHPVLLARDPRDIFVSQLMYRGSHVLMWDKCESEILRILSLLKRKEEEPQSISFKSLLKELPVSAARFPLMTGFNIFAGISRISDVFVYRYEDYISGNTTALSDYLGFEIPSDIKVPEFRRRVERTKGMGSWRHWFTKDDIDFIKSICSIYMHEFGYDFNDWDIAEKPEIESTHCSEYFLRVVNERRRLSGLSQIITPDYPLQAA